MRRAILASLLFAVPAGFGAWACTTDSFSQDGGEGGAVITATDFCNGLTEYINRCSPGTCLDQMKTQCPTLFTDLNATVTRVATQCEEAGTLACDTDYTKALSESPCFTKGIEGGIHTPAVDKLAKDYCMTCRPADVAACVANFDNPGPPMAIGFGVSLFDDSVVANLDEKCTKPDGGTDAGGVCDVLFAVCVYDILGASIPPLGCVDAATKD